MQKISRNYDSAKRLIATAKMHVATQRLDKANCEHAAYVRGMREAYESTISELKSQISELRDLPSVSLKKVESALTERWNYYDYLVSQGHIASEDAAKIQSELSVISNMIAGHRMLKNH